MDLIILLCHILIFIIKMGFDDWFMVAHSANHNGEDEAASFAAICRIVCGPFRSLWTDPHLLLLPDLLRCAFAVKKINILYNTPSMRLREMEKQQ